MLESDFIENDTNMYVPVPDMYDIDDVLPRCSKDKCTNNFGRTLLNFCKTSGLRILNGLTKGDEEGHFTYISHTGKSVVDYAITSIHSLNTIISSFTVVSNPLSDHMPISTEVNLNFNNSDQIMRDTGIQTSTFTKYIWNNNKKYSFLSKVESLVSAAFESEDYNDVVDCAYKLCMYFMKLVNQ